jgi:hypothetical protein
MIATRLRAFLFCALLGLGLGAAPNNPPRMPRRDPTMAA